MLRITVILCTMFLLGFSVIAPYKIGDTVADFSLKNIDGRMVSLSGYKDAKGFIIVFTANHCPFAKRYQDRLNIFSQKYAPLGFPLLAVSSNDAGVIEEDSYAQMIVRAKEHKYVFPYLYDGTQAVARAFGVIKTPQAFVIFKERGVWRLKYSGAIDDNGAEPEKVQHHYLEDAVNALLDGKAVPVAETRSVGCGIKWKQ